MSLDTLRIARELRDADVAPAQAEAIAAAIGNAVNEGAATKADVAVLVQRMEAFELRMDSRFEAVGSEIKASEEKLSRKIEASRAWLLAWFVSIMIAAIGMLIAVLKVL